MNQEPEEAAKDCGPRPRAYDMAKRRVATDENRTKILAAARELVMTADSFSSFTIDAVAQRAGVARMTVYYQFKSKPKLLAALLDDLAARGGLQRLPEVFQQPDPRVALEQYITIFGEFSTANRLVQRRLNALSELDKDFREAVGERGGWRRKGAQVLVQRLNAAYGWPAGDLEEAAGILYTLTAFSAFDSLAGEEREPADVVPVVLRTVLAAFGLEEKEK